jgi:hypothetical protein
MKQPDTTDQSSVVRRQTPHDRQAAEIKAAGASVFLVEVGRRLPFPSTPIQFVPVDKQFETALRHVQSDLIAVPHQPKRPAGGPAGIPAACACDP